VTLYTAAGAVVADATVPAGTAGTPQGPYRYVGIAPVTLAPGDYVIGAFYPSDGSTTADPIVFTPTVDGGSALAVTGGRYSLDGDVFPTTSAGNTAVFGPNLWITVPEPAAACAARLAGAVAALGPRRRWRGARTGRVTGRDGPAKWTRMTGK
jgi:hypothetical protein